MKIISFITEDPIIRKILKHLGLWETDFSPLRHARAPPTKPETPEIVWIPVDDAGWVYPDRPDIAD